ncbi:hypothetical protein LG832_003604 [Acinetobacter baumannii]|uniref:hypothetical protein n=1 Tax=Acinetobacter baumannii TaxID=470 RepID=UPI00089343E0|nr:hypothetical protein [Acinetobacter baumannii]EKV1658177.1 hypothetical protein [Acinetobacter baumannii]EKV1847088.1 hypothetical protein [Acinetobacter baumannii]EKV4645631.1 hypothetical protein [Acinetobacter baumannii]MBF6833638.1 hypothetical protein [Acinetobacter baumannii]MDK3064889.1 hypothetical protein [Acinetobacter baumannii]
MSWVAVGVGVIGMVGGLAGNKSARKTQKEALALERQKFEYAQKIREQYQNQYGGLIDLVIADAEKGVDPDLGRVTAEASADTATSFKNAQTALENQQQRMGINPNSGRADSANRQLALNQAVATAGNVTQARNTERKNASDQTWNRRFGVYQVGTNLISGAQNAVTNSMSSLANTLSNSAGQQQQNSSQAIAGGLSTITQGVLGQLNQNTQKPATTIPISDIGNATQGLKVNGTNVSSGVIYDDTKGITPAMSGSFLS